MRGAIRIEIRADHQKGLSYSVVKQYVRGKKEQLGDGAAMTVYASVCLVSVFVVADKEAAIMFIVFFGHYPALKRRLDGLRSGAAGIQLHPHAAGRTLLKRWIEGENGHLSNEDAAAFAVQLARSGTTRFVLGHLSLQNNLPEIAYLTTRGWRRDRPYSAWLPL